MSKKHQKSRWGDVTAILTGVTGVLEVAPGHTMKADAGTVVLEFGPYGEFKKLTDTVSQNLDLGDE